MQGNKLIYSTYNKTTTQRRVCDCEEEREQMRVSLPLLVTQAFFIEEWYLDVWNVFDFFVSTECLVFFIVSPWR
jgi:hypothetical protein